MPGYARPTNIITGTQVTIVPSGNISSTNMQSAIYELDTNKASSFLSASVTNISASVINVSSSVSNISASVSSISANISSVEGVALLGL